MFAPHLDGKVRAPRFVRARHLDGRADRVGEHGDEFRPVGIARRFGDAQVQAHVFFHAVDARRHGFLDAPQRVLDVGQLARRTAHCRQRGDFRFQSLAHFDQVQQRLHRLFRQRVAPFAGLRAILRADEGAAALARDEDAFCLQQGDGFAQHRAAHAEMFGHRLFRWQARAGGQAIVLELLAQAGRYPRTQCAGGEAACGGLRRGEGEAERAVHRVHPCANGFQMALPACHYMEYTA
ncbi:hypothetical protein D3C81_448850 [compost metagenome]